MIEYTIGSWIIIDNLNRVLLIKRKFNKKYYPNCWSYPWWHQDKNETIEETATREVKEEVWLNFKITELFEQKTITEKDDLIYFSRYLWNYSWDIKVLEKESDWYGWFYYKEIKKLKLDRHIKSSIETLYQKWILK